MNKDIKLLFKNVVYTFISNGTSFVVNALVVLLIPKMIGISDYGYYQLYVLMAAYALYFHFGWCDGIYLRYVGQKYDGLDKEMLSSQFKGISALSVGLSVFLLSIIQFFVNNPDRMWVYSLSAFSIAIITPKIFTSVVMQMVNRMKQYSQIVLIEKAVYAAVLVIMLCLGVRNYKFLILSDIIGKISALLLGIYFCRDIIFCKTALRRFFEYKKETTKNIRVGIFLLLSNLASLLITGIVQFCVESKWDIETFSRVSLTFNLSKMLMVVITAMSIVLVPVLKHMNEKQLPDMYQSIRSILMSLLGAMLVFYFPLKVVLSMWLPQYIISLRYMALLFPMCLFESKTQLLINTYLKALREERKLCSVNLMTVIISAAVASLTVFVMEDLNIALLSIPYLLAFRCIVLEYYISKKLKLKLLQDAVLEIGLATVFIAVNWFIQSWFSILIYLVFYLLYMIHIRKDLKNTIGKILNR